MLHFICPVFFTFLAFSSASPISEAASSPRYLFTFGDSYTTTQFNPQGTLPSTSNPFGNPPYPGVTTDNGANWLGVLVHSLSPANTLSYNLAFGGATVDNSIAGDPPIPSFVDQVNETLTYFPPSRVGWNGDNSAFAVWFARKHGTFMTFDYSFLRHKSVTDGFLQQTYQKQLTTLTSINSEIFTSYFKQLDILYTAGARRFLLIGMDELDRIPYFQALPNNIYDVLVAADVHNWNKQLNTYTSNFTTTHPDASVSILDSLTVFNNILNHPKAHGAPNATCYDSDGTTCLWWDVIHPGQVIQAAIGKAAHSALSKLGFYS